MTPSLPPFIITRPPEDLVGERAEVAPADEVTIQSGDPLDDPADDTSRSLSFGLGNGALFVLALDPEVAFAHPGSPDPACFFAGGRLIDLPNGLALSWRHDGESTWFKPRPDQLLHGNHRLLLSDGITVREALVEDDENRQTLWRETRLVSLAHAHVVMLRWELTPLNWSGPVLVRSVLGVRAQSEVAHPAWAHAGTPRDVHDLLPADGLAARVTGPGEGQALRVDVTLRTSGAPCRQAGRAHDHDQSYQQRCLELTVGAKVCIDVAMTVVEGGAPPVAPVPGFDQELERHRAAWQSLWTRVQLSMPEQAPLERACRFNAFHLLQAVSPLSVGRDVGLPAWSTLDGAPGHDAWDETMALPFYSLHLPALARELLQHRARRLDGHAARAWHGAAPFGVWRHHLATRDAHLLALASGDVLVTAARWWCSRPAAERSLVAAWALRCAARLREHVDGTAWTQLCNRLQIEPFEPARWHDLSRAVVARWQPGSVLSLPGGDGADTLTLLHLLGEAGATDLLAHVGETVPPGWYARTVRHHVGVLGPFTATSRVVCAGALAAVDPAASWAHFHTAVHAPLTRRARLDEGLSFGAMGGVWDVLQRHYLGLQPGLDGLHLAPRPPDALDRVTVRVCLAGRWLTVRLDGRHLSLHPSPGSPPLVLHHAGERHEVGADKGWTVACR